MLYLELEVQMSRKQLYELYAKQNTEKEIHYFFAQLMSECNEFLTLGQIAKIVNCSLHSAKSIVTTRSLPQYESAKILLTLHTDMQNLKLLLEAKYGY
jgi:hypothetical protein